VDEVVVAGVQDHLRPLAADELAERLEIGERQGIHEPRLVSAIGDLDQRQPLRIVMEAVAFGVERDLVEPGEMAHHLLEIGRGRDPAWRG